MITKSYGWRKTAVALAAFTLLGFSTSSALALSLGSMTVRSALGEPLRAEIDVTSITPEEVNSFSIRVAPPDAFVSAGLEYNSVLKNTLATLQRRPDGRHYIRLSSNSPINEPYLDLILEANSSSGRVARDYPMLFDPPVRSQTATAAATAPVPVLAQVPQYPADPDIEPYPSYPSYSSYPSAPSNAQPMQSAQSAQPASAYRIPIIDDTPRATSRSNPVAGDDLNARNISEASPAAGPSAAGVTPHSSASVGDAMTEEFPDFSQIPINANTSDGRAARQPTKRTKTTTASTRPKSRAVARLRHSSRPAIQTAAEGENTSVSGSPVPTGLTVGANASSVVVKRGDTAAKIAESVKPANVSLDEMLAALVRANPDAFINNDPNRIRVGAVLKVPGSEGGAGTAGGGDATQSLTAESQNFDKYRRNLATQAPHTPTEGASRKAMGRIQTQVEEKNAIATAPDKLTLSKGAMQGKSIETAIANERATKETSNRAADMNKNIADLQKLGASTPALPASAVVPPASAARPASAVIPPASAAAMATSAPASALRPASAVAAISSPASAVLPASAIASATLPASAASVAPAASAVASAMSTASIPASGAASSAASSASANVSAGKTPTISTPSPSLEPTIFEDLFGSEDMLLPVVGGVGVLLAGLGGLAFWRSRKRKEEMLAEESSFIESRIPPDSFFGASGGQHVDTSQEEDNHNSSAMIYSPSQLNAIDDVDPVAEADVYLAYGRDVQAEEILREALLTNPGRAAIHTKLLEILSKRQDTEAFEVAATQASHIVKKDSPEWAHICEMGQGIDPSNTLYQLGRPASSGPGMQIFASSASPAPLADTNDAEAEDEPLPSHHTSLAPTQAQSDVDLDLDLDFSADDNAPTVAPSSSLSPASEHASISMSAPLSIPPLRPEPPPAPVSAPAPDLNINLDAALDMEFDLSAPAPAPAPVQASAPEPLDAGDKSLEEMLKSLNFDEPPNAFALPNSGAPKPAALPPAASIPANPDGNGALLEFNLDDFQLPSSTPAPAGGGSGGSGGRLEDPLETKLALAQEFVAIGDEFGAREILEEVIASATGDLQAKARAALAKLG